MLYSPWKVHRSDQNRGMDKGQSWTTVGAFHRDDMIEIPAHEGGELCKVIAHKFIAFFS